MEESEKINIALKCVNKNWDFEDLKYCDDMYGNEQYAYDIWEYVTECEDIGKIAFIQKYNLK